MRRMALTLSCLLTLWAGAAAAQVQAQAEPAERGNSATQADTYCAGMITNEEIPYDNYVISGPEADPQTIYSDRQYVYINKGTEGGVKVGDDYMVLRPVKDFLHVRVWDSEHLLANQMGQQWADVGRIHVVVVHPKTAIAEITYSCGYMQRGDYVRPVVNYPAPNFKPLKDLDRFAPPSGKATARVVRAKNYQMLAGRGTVVYANLTGVKPGDYIRFFRYSGARSDSIYQIGGITDHVFGFGKTPEHWAATDVPREVLGEGVVLRATPTSASVLIFNLFHEIYLGDWVEVE